VNPPAKALWRADLALAGNTLIWGGTFVMVKQALADVSPVLFLALRFSLATAALLVLLRGAWSNPRRLRLSLGAGVLAGVFLFSGYLLQTLGLRLTTPSKSAFVTGSATVMVPLLAALVYQVRPRVVEVAGVLVATAGMGMMTLEGPSLRMGSGDLLTLGCAGAFAAHIVVLGHYSTRMSFQVLALAQIATSALLGIALCGWAETPRLVWNARVTAAVAVTGLLATAVAFTIQAWAQQYTTSTRTALIYTLEPVVAGATSYLLTGERLSHRAAAGAGLILASILLVELKPMWREQHPSK
jgi:drug/metabolite transporter (DMT)-like permease